MRNRARKLEWGAANRPKVSNRLGNPTPREGSDGDIQIRQTEIGAKLFAKLGGSWLSNILYSQNDPIILKTSKDVTVSGEQLNLSIFGVGTALKIDTSGNIGIGEVNPDNILHVKNASGVTKEVVKLEQLDDDEPFIKFTGTSASDQTKSITTDTSVGSHTGHILVNVNDTDYWIPYYAKN